jgi:hypothetical protein
MGNVATCRGQRGMIAGRDEWLEITAGFFGMAEGGKR